MGPFGGDGIDGVGGFIGTRSLPGFALGPFPAGGRGRLKDVGGGAARREVAWRRRHLKTVYVSLDLAAVVFVAGRRCGVVLRTLWLFCF